MHPPPPFVLILSPPNKQNHGNELERARDLFYALWTPDLFMERVENDGDWALFCPNEAPGLADVHGEEFNRLYEKYEKEGKARKVIKAQQLWFAILDSQVETGTPYMLVSEWFYAVSLVGGWVCVGKGGGGARH